MPPITEKPQEDNTNPDKLIVCYDGACPKCIRDRENYEKLSGPSGEQVCWFDITGQENRCHQLGIDSQKALTELHVRDTKRPDRFGTGCIHSVDE